ncbi:hypothetical protein EES43_18130 [Streptomyces sp. ADI96-02]|uniref:XRE family transcriptional regulator n=1 Tax=Streptomyces sp. ADI96-02 TaxID=1522760 RepID=UPI000F553F6B|nr:XRE family transcriptional regulator [Streptomyces sp. ADI96-02]RPK59634.1 hypothetical protein EES43_18130 [Streptomyces sp. ADI96-02]
MPRWKALPEELDPQIREFAGQLRRLVDRSGLNIDAVADRTGYSETSWERYLDGRLLPPRGAVVALAEVTNTPQHHLSTMWELAEQAWRRAEMRHDMTMEAIRVSQARAALGAGSAAAPSAAAPSAAGTGPAGGTDPGGHGGHGSHGSHGQGVPAQGAPGHAAYAYGGYGGYGDDGRAPSVPVQRGGAPQTAEQPRSGRRSDRGSGGRGPGGRRKTARFVVGLTGALLVAVGAVLLAPSGDEPAKAAPSASATPSTAAPELPVGVECSGDACTGKDPEAMGCGGQFARTVANATVGTSRVEVRYSEICAASWARLTEAAPGDTVRITSGAGGQDGTVRGETDAYTPMVAVRTADGAKACATLTSGTRGCAEGLE